MKSTSFRDAFRSGHPLTGFQLTSFGPHWPRQLAGAIDFAFIDCEHHCFSREQVAWMCVGYRGAGIAPIVRVLRPDASLVRAAMDDGAQGVVVPYVETVEQVRSVVAAAKLRPIQGERAASAMSGKPLDESMMATSNKHCGDVSLILQIESETAVQRCDSLVSVDGVDGVLVGPYDLTATLGCLGQHEDTRFQEAAKTIAKIVRGKGLGAGIYFAESPQKEVMAAEWGYNLMIRGCDWTLVREALAMRQATSS
ncbi:2-keto-3-deoxy-L-rhamnonate aldolase [Rubripirellula tenax]|uniref:2-keto-3-deoxy-L-rhamnonate aldolase n=1 Tax=Rubripirellula tenax TaxID=2528015 RepID=A0A5C6EI15_9BACT|nr:aldolase/citrate lyase family protein [Rubripirellula tenax]TWU47276.1 2-keto-3-deoxy-L-rhamnonate aldolase [Rubripirellula tenax]